MNIEVFGARASGKSTLGKAIARERSLSYISLGDIARAEIEKKNGKSEVIKQAIVDREYPHGFLPLLIEPVLSDGFVMDGYPRKGWEAEEFVDLLATNNKKLDVIIDIDIPLETLQDRATRRRICSKCGYQGEEAGACCNLYLTRRTDDTPEEIEKGYLLYKEESEETKRILQLYTNAKLITLSDMGSIPALIGAAIYELNTIELISKVAGALSTGRTKWGKNN